MPSNRARLTPIALLLAALGSPVPSQAGAGSIAPSPARQGAEVVIAYDPSSPGAAFVGADAVHAVLWISWPERTDVVWFPLDPEGGTFRASFVLPADAGYLEAQFVTPHGWDETGAAETPLLRADGEPARGAMQRKILRAGGLDAFEEEIGRYPDNLVAYTLKWRWLALQREERLPRIVEEDLRTIRSAADAASPELLYAEVLADVERRDEAGARADLERLVRADPESVLVSKAFYEYWVASFQNQWRGEGPERIEAIRRDYIRQQPDSAVARESCETLALDETFPLESIDDIGDTWIAEQPDHPTPYLCMAGARLTREVDLEAAAAYADLASRLTLRGHLRFYESVAGQLVPGALSRAYLVRARIELLEGRPETALAALRAAQGVGADTDAASYVTEGRLWHDLGAPQRAAEAWRRAFRAGSREAEGLLREMHRERGGDEAGVEELLYGEVAASDEDIAPPFRVADMRGDELDLGALRGKVVVLNFWSTGCAPCIVEMPGLNELVRELAGRDVVFVAPAPDPKKILKRFLRDQEFLYRVVPEAQSLLDAYGVRGIPVHVVIDREGRIAARLTGGSAERHRDLAPIVERLLH